MASKETVAYLNMEPAPCPFCTEPASIGHPPQTTVVLDCPRCGERTVTWMAWEELKTYTPQERELVVTNLRAEPGFRVIDVATLRSLKE